MTRRHPLAPIFVDPDSAAFVAGYQRGLDDGIPLGICIHADEVERDAARAWGDGYDEPRRDDGRRLAAVLTAVLRSPTQLERTRRLGDSPTVRELRGRLAAQESRIWEGWEVAAG